MIWKFESIEIRVFESRFCQRNVDTSESSHIQRSRTLFKNTKVKRKWETVCRNRAVPSVPSCPVSVPYSSLSENFETWNLETSKLGNSGKLETWNVETVWKKNGKHNSNKWNSSPCSHSLKLLKPSSYQWSGTERLGEADVKTLPEQSVAYLTIQRSRNKWIFPTFRFQTPIPMETHAVMATKLRLVLWTPPDASEVDAAVSLWWNLQVSCLVTSIRGLKWCA